MTKNHLEYIPLLMNNRLFEGISSEDIENILVCLNAFVKNYEKKETVIRENEPIPGIGIILRGSIQISKTDLLGNINIIAEPKKNQLFAETFEAAGIHISPVRVTSKESTKILFIQYGKMMNMCSNSCVFHSRMIVNMMKIIAVKNTELNKKIDILSKRTIREKLMAYFLMEMNLQGKSRKIRLAFSKTDLADYICTDRSSMSREISRMQEDGIIQVKGRDITII
ncbi:Crp/Fnr family transcriptional regulator [Proteocatella sphenisci]|uniref:Crp/Fnr family transcriptional regulator n=1 Tax=Proteocatella sphenisci TaxID=181070 RepID=UPI00048B8FF7|nr:Crp/Fnr family transcriptional regulator [Proteocatella sphenisci]